MARFKEQLVSLLKKDFPLSKNVWIDLLGHCMVGLVVGGVIVWVRDISPMPALLLTTTVCGLWGIRNRIAK
jgi:hypothetical protein